MHHRHLAGTRRTQRAARRTSRTLIAAAAAAASISATTTTTAVARRSVHARNAGRRRTAITSRLQHKTNKQRNKME